MSDFTAGLHNPSSSAKSSAEVLAAARERFEEAVNLEYHFFEYCYAPGQAL